MIISPTKIPRIILFIFLVLNIGTVQGQQADIKRELKRLNAKIDRERVRTDSLETQISILLPDLRNTLIATVDAKKQTDSVAILLINRINTLQNKIRMLEDKSIYTDSTNFVILAQLMMIENKIVTLTNSFTEMYSLRSEKRGGVIKTKISPAEYQRRYIEALSYYQNSDYNQGIKGFSELVLEDPSNKLADNSQYWLAECYYSTKNYKRAALEFEKVFTFPGTDKDDDSQLKLALAYQSLGNLVKAREEYQRMVDYFPSSEYYSRAKESLKQLSIE
ncbi:MAG TPA: tetratricopeptide repeat protein [Candidatus Marinimicrobia bacterium]|jgi:TolA-binding protein|nr:tetratricopeptide repeat protein [Candidatus Neomarinimicrobiota bacterium]|tara:strand:- start:64 stop:894 length:831 start_codon:yes stop_codon:yes gene_type:complete